MTEKSRLPSPQCGPHFLHFTARDVSFSWPHTFSDAGLSAVRQSLFATPCVSTSCRLLLFSFITRLKICTKRVGAPTWAGPATHRRRRPPPFTPSNVPHRFLVPHFFLPRHPVLEPVSAAAASVEILLPAVAPLRVPEHIIQGAGLGVLLEHLVGVFVHLRHELGHQGFAASPVGHRFLGDVVV